MEKIGPSDLYRSLTEPDGWRERDKARAAAFIDAIPRLGGDPQEPGGDDGDYLLPLPPVGHPLHTLGVRLAELLDEDQWAECERMLSEGWDKDRVDRKTGADWRQNSSLDVWFPNVAAGLQRIEQTQSLATAHTLAGLVLRGFGAEQAKRVPAQVAVQRIMAEVAHPHHCAPEDVASLAQQHLAFCIAHRAKMATMLAGA